MLRFFLVLGLLAQPPACAASPALASLLAACGAPCQRAGQGASYSSFVVTSSFTADAALVVRWTLPAASFPAQARVAGEILAFTGSGAPSVAALAAPDAAGVPSTSFPLGDGEVTLDSDFLSSLYDTCSDTVLLRLWLTASGARVDGSDSYSAPFALCDGWPTSASVSVTAPAGEEEGGYGLLVQDAGTNLTVAWEATGVPWTGAFDVWLLDQEDEVSLTRLAVSASPAVAFNALGGGLGSRYALNVTVPLSAAGLVASVLVTPSDAPPTPDTLADAAAAPALLFFSDPAERLVSLSVNLPALASSSSAATFFLGSDLAIAYAGTGLLASDALEASLIELNEFLATDYPPMPALAGSGTLPAPLTLAPSLQYVVALTLTRRAFSTTAYTRPFALLPPGTPVLALALPPASSTFYLGGSLPLTWGAAPAPGSLKFELWSATLGYHDANGDLPCGTLALAAPEAALAATLPLPFDPTLPPGAFYFVRASRVGAGYVGGDSPFFTLLPPAFEFLSPIATSVFASGDTLPIAWRSAGVARPVTIELWGLSAASRESALVAVVTSSGDAARAGMLAELSGLQAGVYSLQAYEGASRERSVVSAVSQYFAVSAPASLTLTAPAGTAPLPVASGATLNLTWTSQGLPASALVNITLAASPSATAAALLCLTPQGTENTGLFLWASPLVPTMPGAPLWVVVTPLSAPALAAVASAPYVFALQQVALQVTAAPTAAPWKAGSRPRFSWTLVGSNSAAIAALARASACNLTLWAYNPLSGDTAVATLATLQLCGGGSFAGYALPDSLNSDQLYYATVSAPSLWGRSDPSPISTSTRSSLGSFLNATCGSGALQAVAGGAGALLCARNCSACLAAGGAWLVGLPVAVNVSLPGWQGSAEDAAAAAAFLGDGMEPEAFVCWPPPPVGGGDAPKSLALGVLPLTPLTPTNVTLTLFADTQGAADCRQGSSRVALAFTASSLPAALDANAVKAAIVAAVSASLGEGVSNKQLEVTLTYPPGLTLAPPANASSAARSRALNAAAVSAPFLPRCRPGFAITPATMQCSPMAASVPRCAAGYTLRYAATADAFSTLQCLPLFSSAAVTKCARGNGFSFALDPASFSTSVTASFAGQGCVALWPVSPTPTAPVVLAATSAPSVSVSVATSDAAATLPTVTAVSTTVSEPVEEGRRRRLSAGSTPLSLKMSRAAKTVSNATAGGGVSGSIGLRAAASRPRCGAGNASVILQASLRSVERVNSSLGSVKASIVISVASPSTTPSFSATPTSTPTPSRSPTCTPTHTPSPTPSSTASTTALPTISTSSTPSLSSTPSASPAPLYFPVSACGALCSVYASAPVGDAALLVAPLNYSAALLTLSYNSSTLSSAYLRPGVTATAALFAYPGGGGSAVLVGNISVQGGGGVWEASRGPAGVPVDVSALAASAAAALPPGMPRSACFDNVWLLVTFAGAASGRAASAPFAFCPGAAAAPVPSLNVTLSRYTATMNVDALNFTITSRHLPWTSFFSLYIVVLWPPELAYIPPLPVATDIYAGALLSQHAAQGYSGAVFAISNFPPFMLGQTINTTILVSTASVAGASSPLLITYSDVSASSTVTSQRTPSSSGTSSTTPTATLSPGASPSGTSSPSGTPDAPTGASPSATPSQSQSASRTPSVLPAQLAPINFTLSISPPMPAAAAAAWNAAAMRAALAPLLAVPPTSISFLSFEFAPGQILPLRLRRLNLPPPSTTTSTQLHCSAPATAPALAAALLAANQSPPTAAFAAALAEWVAAAGLPPGTPATLAAQADSGAPGVGSPASDGFSAAASTAAAPLLAGPALYGVIAGAAALVLMLLAAFLWARNARLQRELALRGLTAGAPAAQGRRGGPQGQSGGVLAAGSNNPMLVDAAAGKSLGAAASRRDKALSSAKQQQEQQSAPSCSPSTSSRAIRGISFSFSN